MPRPRIPSKLSESLHQRLNSYALAASAAGVGMLALFPAQYALPAGLGLAGLLALSEPAEGKVVYTSTHLHINVYSNVLLDLNHDGIVDFNLKDVFHAQGTASTYGFLAALPAKFRNQVWGNTTYTSRGYPWASAFRRGFRIGGKRHFLSGGGEMVFSFGQGGAYCIGPWANGKNRYLGLKFQIHGKTHYGWARLNVTCNHPTVTATLTGYAYETIPNKPIIAGKTKGKDVITVQPASLGQLARGASAIEAWRQKVQ